MSNDSGIHGKNIIFYSLGVFVLLFSIVIYKYKVDSLDCVLELYDVLDSFDSGKEFNANRNTYLQGNFRPVTEEVNNLPLEVLGGAIPRDLAGMTIN